MDYGDHCKEHLYEFLRNVLKIAWKSAKIGLEILYGTPLKKYSGFAFPEYTLTGKCPMIHWESLNIKIVATITEIHANTDHS
jgi:hypothetical protein